MILYDFKCSCGEIFEGLARIDERTRKCGSCGLEANRMVSAPSIKLEGWSGHFPSSHSKWVRQHEKAGGQTT
jgi:putative FmdB family regulatory protein